MMRLTCDSKCWQKAGIENSTSACRAFIHHLLDARELLGDMLLDYHNTHHLQQFMHALRCSIERGEFQAFCERFGVEHAGAGDTNGAAA